MLLLDDGVVGGDSVNDHIILDKVRICSYPLKGEMYKGLEMLQWKIYFLGVLKTQAVWFAVSLTRNNCTSEYYRTKAIPIRIV